MLPLLQHAAGSVVLVPMQTSCSFAGAWGGGQLPKAFYVSSYFWDRALEAGALIGSGSFSLACNLHDVVWEGAMQLAHQLCSQTAPAGLSKRLSWNVNFVCLPC